MAIDALYEGRRERIRTQMSELGLTQALICDPTSIAWATGFSVDPGERFLGLLIREEASPLLILNELFGAPDDLGIELKGYRDTDDPLSIVIDSVDSKRPLACDKNMTASVLLALQERHCASGFVRESALDAVRSIKDAHELDLMRHASAINDQAMAWLKAQAHEGVTERQIAEALLDEYKRLGAEGFSFTPIVSFAAHAADPHHEPDDTALTPGDTVLFDVGCTYKGYCSDMTRTFFYKQATDEQRNVYELVKRANAAAAAKVAPGVLFSEIDAAARDIIEQAGYGKEFTHRLGHQIGTNVHEPGDVSATHHEPVRPGMCFSDEPGIYLVGKFGVRIEDLITVTETGAELLNHYPREFEILE